MDFDEIKKAIAQKLSGFIQNKAPQQRTQPQRKSLNPVLQGIVDLPRSAQITAQRIPQAVNDLVMKPRESANLVRTAPKYMQFNIPGSQTLANLSANTAQVFGQGQQDMAMGINQIQKAKNPFEVLKGGAKTVYGGAQTLAPFLPGTAQLFQGANLLTSVPQSSEGPINNLQRFSSGLLKGIAQNQELAPNVKRKESIRFNLPFVNEEVGIDPFEAAGGMIGFVTNPANKTLFKITEKVFPAGQLGSGANLKRWLATTGIRGSIEDTLLSLEHFPTDASPQEKVAFMLANAATGAATEIGGRGTLDLLGTGKTKIKNTKLYEKAFDELRQLTTPMQKFNPKTGKAEVKPLWKWQLEDERGFANFGVLSGAEDTSKTFTLYRGEGNVNNPARFQTAYGSGKYFYDNPNDASVFGNVSKVEVTAKNPLDVTDQKVLEKTSMDMLREGFEDMGTWAKSKGYDMIIDKNTGIFVDLSEPKGILGDQRGFVNVGLFGIDAKADTPKVKIDGGDKVLNEARSQIKLGVDDSQKSAKQHFKEFYRDWVNRFQPVEDVVSNIEKQTKSTILPSNNPKYAFKRLLGAGGTAELRYKQVLQPILDEIPENVKQQDFDVFMKAKRDIELGDRGVKGSDPTQAKAVIEALGKKYDLAQLDSVATKLYKYQDDSLRMLRDSGFINENSYQTIKSLNQNYVPFQRVMDEVDNYLGVPTRKAQVGTQPINKIKGSERAIYSPMESIIANTYKVQAVVSQNNVARSVANLSKVGGDLYKDMFPKVSKSGNDTITVWENGQKNYYQVGEEVASVLKGMNEENMAGFMKILAAPARLLRQGATGRNIDFMIPNIFRDQFDASINSKYGYKPFIDYFVGLGHLLKYKYGGGDEVVERWLKGGGGIFFENMSGRKAISEQIESATTKPKLTKRLFNWLIGGIEEIGELSESPTRVGLFNNAYKKTGNVDLSVYEARESTLDFARMGAKMKTANALIPFLNVGVQGFDKLIRSAKDHPGKFVFNAALFAGTPAVMTTLHNLQNYPDVYADIPQFEKDGNFIIVTGRDKEGIPTYLKFPKGNIVPYFANPTEHMLSWMAGEEQQSFAEMALNTLTEELPLIGGGSNPTEILSHTIGENLPQVVKPSIEGITNYSFFKNRPLVPNYMQNKPAALQFREGTPEIYQRLGIALNMSPAKIENFLEGHFAGFIKIPTNTLGIMMDIGEGKDVKTNEIAVVRRFIGNYGNKPGERDYYNMLDEQREAEKNFGKPSFWDAIKFGGEVGATEVSPKDSKEMIAKLKLAEDRAELNVKLNGGYEIVNNKIKYQNDDYGVSTINLNKAIPNDTDSPFERAKKLDEAYALTDDLLDADLSPEDLEASFKKVGIPIEDAIYYQTAREENSLKSIYVQDEISNITNREKLFQQLVEWRRKVNNKEILSNGVIDDLVDEGILTKAEGSQLKKLEYTEKDGKPEVKFTGRGSGSSIKRVKFSAALKDSLTNSKINISAPKIAQAPSGLSTPNFAPQNVKFNVPVLEEQNIPIPDFKSKIKFNI